MPAQLLRQHAFYRYIFGELNATKCNYHGIRFSVHALDNLTLLEPDVQDLTAIAHEPSSSRICKSNCPVATHFGQLEPSATLIRSPSGSSGFEVRFPLGGNHNGTVVLVAVVEFFIIVMTTAVELLIMLWRIASMSTALAADIGEAENGSLHGRLARKSPCAAPIIRGCRLS